MEFLTDHNTAFEVEERRPILAFLPMVPRNSIPGICHSLPTHLLGEKLSSEILSAVDRLEVAFLLHTLPISSSEENTGFIGTVSFTPLTMRGIVRDAWDSVHRAGFRWLVVAPWHGGNFILKPVVRELNHELGRCGVIYLNPWEHVPKDIYEQFAPGFEVHCGDVETSLILALCPETVRDERHDNPVPFNAIWQDMFSMKTLSGGEGHAGHPSRATADKGRELAHILAEHSARYLENILKMAEMYETY